MVLAGIIGASGWFYLANFAETPFQATAASIVASLGVAVSDVVADSIVVEKVRPMVVGTHDMLGFPMSYAIAVLGASSVRVWQVEGMTFDAFTGKTYPLLRRLRTFIDIASSLHAHTLAADRSPCTAIRYCRPGEGFGFPGRRRRVAVLVLGVRFVGRDRQRLLFWLPLGNHDDERGVLADDVPPAADHGLRDLHRRAAANRVAGQVREG